VFTAGASVVGLVKMHSELYVSVGCPDKFSV